MIKLIPDFVSKLFKKEEKGSGGGSEVVVNLSGENVKPISEHEIERIKSYYKNGMDPVATRMISMMTGIRNGGDVCLGHGAQNMKTNLPQEFITEQEILQITSLTDKARKKLEAANKFPMRLTVQGGDVIYGHCYWGKDVRDWYELKQSKKRKPRKGK